MTLFKFFCCWLRGENIDEMFEACLFRHDREEIEAVMTQHKHTPESMSKLHRPSDHCTLLLVASVAGDSNLVQLLLEKGDAATLLATDDMEGNSPLLCACLGGHAAVVSALLNCKAAMDSDLPSRPNHQGTTPLMAAAWRGHLDLVKQVMKQDGVSLTSKDVSGRTAKDLAKEWGHKHVIEWIDTNLKQEEARQLS